VHRILGRLLVPQQRMRESQFRSLPAPTADVVFLGDSITQYGLWSEWFPRHRVVNRGVIGDTTSGLLSRIDTAVGRQDVVSLLIGTNDIAIGVRPARIAGNVAAIMAAIRAADASSKILLNSVMPRARGYRAQLGELNRRLSHLAEAEGAAFLDLWPALADDHGVIRPELSADGLHLTGAGYAAWVDVLREHIRS
jgi:lysophospholipase L1-like esterase